MPSKTELLVDVPIFALLDDTERAALADKMEVRQVRAGDVIFSTGDPGDELYVVASGTVEIFVKNHQGERITLETGGSGHVFGELSLLDGGPRTASSVARTDVELLTIDRAGLDQFLRLQPHAAMDMLAATGRRLRESTRLVRASATRNANQETEDKRSAVQRAADWISAFSGSLEFLFLHVGIFAAWILLNSGPGKNLPFGSFDPFPYGLLTMCVSLEAIILSVFVLLSQSRQVAREQIRNDIEYEVNVRAELEITALHEKMDDFRSDTLARLQAIEQKVR